METLSVPTTKQPTCDLLSCISKLTGTNRILRGFITTSQSSHPDLKIKILMIGGLVIAVKDLFSWRGAQTEQVAMDTTSLNLVQRPETHSSHKKTTKTSTSSEIKAVLRAYYKTGDRYCSDLTCGLSQLFTQTYVRKLQHLLPFLAFSFSVSATSCKTNRFGLTKTVRRIQLH